MMLHRRAHTVYKTQYSILWVAGFGRKILMSGVGSYLRVKLREVYQATGRPTMESETAEEGLKLVLEKSPDLILMDIQLPGMDGTTALKHLRGEPRTKTIPLIG